ncbi:hypothetical protein [Planomonospora sp. ID82291]|uniref:hypothetical protein n=1 Tax=Planomonospora sp. ID82291 TaxID=2738136 RepID=UPI0018C4374C|nr:hypothetical protein [Planomonospora sp. ID82291]MBG0818248.1 hypothetical protein [Planomonospora sp. ID82291]
MAAIVEDFEDSTLLFGFSSGTWVRSTARVYRGSYAFSNSDIGDSNTVSTTATAPAGATGLQFMYSVSSEQNYDFLRVYIDGAEKIAVSGEVSWTQSALFPVSPGSTITFNYSKDSSSSPGLDAAFIDDVTFIVPDGPQRAIAGPAAVVRAAVW